MFPKYLVSDFTHLKFYCHYYMKIENVKYSTNVLSTYHGFSVSN